MRHSDYVFAVSMAGMLRNGLAALILILVIENAAHGEEPQRAVQARGVAAMINANNIAQSYPELQIPVPHRRELKYGEIVLIDLISFPGIPFHLSRPPPVAGDKEIIIPLARI